MPKIDSVGLGRVLILLYTKSFPRIDLPALPVTYEFLSADLRKQDPLE